MLKRLIDWLESKVGEHANYKRDAGTTLAAEPEVRGVVRRFQGRYDCGHKWPSDKLAPEDCPIHGEGCERVYVDDVVLDFTSIRVAKSS